MAVKCAQKHHLNATPHGERARRRAAAGAGGLVKRWVCFLDPFCINLGDAHAANFLVVRICFPVTGKCPNDLGKKVPRSQNPVPHCLLFAVLSAMSRPGGGNPDFGQSGSRKHIQCFTTAAAQILGEADNLHRRLQEPQDRAGGVWMLWNSSRVRFWCIFPKYTLICHSRDSSLQNEQVNTCGCGK